MRQKHRYRYVGFFLWIIPLCFPFEASSNHHDQLMMGQQFQQECSLWDIQHSGIHTLVTAILGIFLGKNMESYYYSEPIQAFIDGFESMFSLFIHIFVFFEEYCISYHLEFLTKTTFKYEKNRGNSKIKFKIGLY